MRYTFKGLVLLLMLIGIISISNKDYKTKVKRIDWAKVATQR